MIRTQPRMLNTRGANLVFMDINLLTHHRQALLKDFKLLFEFEIGNLKFLESPYIISQEAQDRAAMAPATLDFAEAQWQTQFAAMRNLK